jgi:hypothetical protein
MGSRFIELMNDVTLRPVARSMIAVNDRPGLFGAPDAC